MARQAGDLTPDDIQNLTPEELAMIVELLLDTDAVAEVMGLSSGAAVRAYISARKPDGALRFPDFPAPVLPRDPQARARNQYWWAPDIWAFLDRHPGLGRKRSRDDAEDPREHDGREGPERSDR